MSSGRRTWNVRAAEESRMERARPARGVAPRPLGRRRNLELRLFPERLQARGTPFGWIAGDERGVHRADRGAGDMRRVQRLVAVERRIGAGLVSAERDATGKDEGNSG